jgi:hypothetical protein
VFRGLSGRVGVECKHQRDAFQQNLQRFFLSCIVGELHLFDEELLDVNCQGRIVDDIISQFEISAFESTPSRNFYFDLVVVLDYEILLDLLNRGGDTERTTFLETQFILQVYYKQELEINRSTMIEDTA